MHVVAQDIDATAVHMTYLQLSLLHVPAIVVHGNSIAMTKWSHWVTPAHVMGGWDWRLRARSRERATETYGVPELSEASPVCEPLLCDEPLEKIRAAVVEDRAEQLSLFG